MTKKKNGKYYVAAMCVFATLAMAIGGILAAQKGAMAYIPGTIPDPKIAVTEFFEAYRREEYEALDKYIYGYESLGFSGTAETEYGKRMLECISSEFVYEISGEPVIRGDRAEVTLKVKYFAIPDSADDLKQLFNVELLSSMKEDFNGIDLSAHNDEYYNGIVLPSLDRAVDKLMERKEQYFRAESLSLDLVYDGTDWRIIPTDDLKEILLGGLI